MGSLKPLAFFRFTDKRCDVKELFLYRYFLVMSHFVYDHSHKHHFWSKSYKTFFNAFWKYLNIKHFFFHFCVKCVCKSLIVHVEAKRKHLTIFPVFHFSTVYIQTWRPLVERLVVSISHVFMRLIFCVLRATKRARSVSLGIFLPLRGKI